MINRRITNTLSVGGIAVGGGNPVSIQSMTNTDTSDVLATVRQIEALTDAGCDIVRVAVPDMRAAEAIGAIKRAIRIPLVADIHFNYKLALESVRQGADKVRINPGNIGNPEHVKRVADAAGERGIPIRIGVNGGSLEKPLLEKYGGPTPEALVESALTQAEMLNRCGFYDVVISIKHSDVFSAVEACRLLAKKAPAMPQHIGLTEAGTAIAGTVKSTVALYELLRDGIGDTLRVSLTGDPLNEIYAAKALLATLDLPRCGAAGGRGGIELISCPTCGRCRIDLAAVAGEVERLSAALRTDKRIKVAVMGCVVNGPGEAREADVGIAGGIGRAMLFKRGIPQYYVPESELTETLMREIAELC